MSETPAAAMDLAEEAAIREKNAPRQTEEVNFHKEVLKKVHDLWTNRNLCDVVLRAGEREIPSHRAILPL